MSMVCHSLFSGFGLADQGLDRCGLEPGLRFELDPRLAEIGQANTRGRYVVGDICEVKWRHYDRPDVLWASPVCKRASVANVSADEEPLDVACAEATARAIAVWRPRVFLLENVWGYRNFDSFDLICHELKQQGYQFGY